MPGITGIFGNGSAEEIGSMVAQMTRCMEHETFYASGQYSMAPLGLWMGWVHPKGSFSDCLPAWNETGDICLFFAGETFTGSSPVGALRARGHQCNFENATYLVHWYEEIGQDFIEKLNGWFSGVLVDLREKKIILFNDRYGLGRIYYYAGHDRFYFSSEAKSLLAAMPELRRLDLQSLAETFSCGCVLQNRTLFTDIGLLPPGSRWILEPNGRIGKESYFTREDWEQLPLLGETEYCNKLEETFARILPQYFTGGRRMAMSLTGGIDGRMIMAWARRPPRELPCYTFGSNYRDCADVSIARRVASTCGQDHHTLSIDPQFFVDFRSLAQKAVYISDGTMDVTGAVELYANSRARQIAPVRLTGNYGSEILRGGIAFRPAQFPSALLTPAFSSLVNNASRTYYIERQCCPLSFISFKQVPWHHYGRLSVEQSQISLRTPYLDNELVSLAYQAPPQLRNRNEPLFRLIAAGNPQLSMLPTDRGLQYPRIPILSKMRNLYREFTFKAEYAYDYGMPQWLARVDGALMPVHLEKLFLGRHKFYHFRVWYRDLLSSDVKDILLDPRSRNRPYLDGARLEEIVLNHTSGRNNHTREIHRLLTTELMQRTLLERDSSSSANRQ